MSHSCSELSSLFWLCDVTPLQQCEVGLPIDRSCEVQASGWVGSGYPGCPGTKNSVFSNLALLFAIFTRFDSLLM